MNENSKPLHSYKNQCVPVEFVDEDPTPVEMPKQFERRAAQAFAGFRGHVVTAHTHLYSDAFTGEIDVLEADRRHDAARAARAVELVRVAIRRGRR